MKIIFNMSLKADGRDLTVHLNGRFLSLLKKTEDGKYSGEVVDIRGDRISFLNAKREEIEEAVRLLNDFALRLLDLAKSDSRKIVSLSEPVEGVATALTSIAGIRPQSYPVIASDYLMLKEIIGSSAIGLSAVRHPT